MHGATMKFSGHLFSAAQYYPHVSSTTTCTQVNVSNLHTCYSPLLSQRPCEDGPIGWKHAAKSTVACYPHLFGSCVDFRWHEYYLQGHRCNNVTCETIILGTPQPNWGLDHINLYPTAFPPGNGTVAYGRKAQVALRPFNMTHLNSLINL